MIATCQSGVDLLTEYLEGSLAPDVAASLEQHVAGCERCQAFVDSYRRTPEILRRATIAELPDDLAERLRGWVREMRKRN